MESVDVSQPNSTNSLVPNAGQQGDTSSSNPLQLPSPESNQSASGEASYISDDAALNAATWFAEEQLDSFVSDEDFLSNMEQAFGDNWQPQQAEDLIQNLASGDAMPKVEVIPGSDLKANGGFGEDTIYLSEEFLSSAKSEQLSGGLIEEIGHFVDQELNSGDSPGDEGDIFQQLVEDKAISDGELVDLKAEDDSGTIALGGEKISVELAELDITNAPPHLNFGQIKVVDSADDKSTYPYYKTPTDEIKLVLDSNNKNDAEIDRNWYQAPLYVKEGENEIITKRAKLDEDINSDETIDAGEGYTDTTRLKIFEKDKDGYGEPIFDENIPIRDKEIFRDNVETFKGNDNGDPFEYKIDYLGVAMTDWKVAYVGKEDPEDYKIVNSDTPGLVFKTIEVIDSADEKSTSFRNTSPNDEIKLGFDTDSDGEEDAAIERNRYQVPLYLQEGEKTILTQRIKTSGEKTTVKVFEKDKDGYGKPMLETELENDYNGGPEKTFVGKDENGDRFEYKMRYIGEDLQEKLESWLAKLG